MKKYPTENVHALNQAKTFTALPVPALLEVQTEEHDCPASNAPAAIAAGHPPTPTTSHDGNWNQCKFQLKNV